MCRQGDRACMWAAVPTRASIAVWYLTETMMAAEFLTIDYVFQGAIGIVMTVLWRYIGKVDGKFDSVQAENHALRERLHEVEKVYQTKVEAREYKGEVLELLREIKSDLKQVSDKLNEKADKK